MAFHQPTHQAMQRAVRPAPEEREASGVHPVAPNQEALDRSQTWTLFQPPSEEQTASEFSETIPSIHTAGRSRLSDFGTLNTVPRSDRLVGDGLSAVEPSIIGHDLAEDDAELDSLDSHLPSFRSVPGLQSHLHHDDDHHHHHHHHGAPVLPGHDGLGSFHLDNPMSGADAQNQIYQFEKFNPRRLRRRRDSLDHAQPELDHELAGEAEKRQRIEVWRLEHSRVLLEEVQKETRRARRSQASLRQVQDLATTAPEPQSPGDSDSDLAWHDEDATSSGHESGNAFLNFTQNALKDLLGIDDRLLSILLGTSFLSDDEDLSSTPRASQLNDGTLGATDTDSNWRDHLLEMVSRELGILVNQLSHHPGAFSTFSKVQQMPLPYAGLPVIPEVAAPADKSSTTDLQPPSADFKPTVGAPTRPISISGRHAESPSADDADMGLFTKEEWEQDLDIKLVFKYLRSRFTSRTSSTPQSNVNHPATSSTLDAAAKAARVRQHHPLTSRTRPTERRTFKATAPSSPAVALRHQSSCASQSTRRSARRSSCSSRHYWDLGGSLGTGSMIASNGPMGSWGEV